MRKKTLRKQLWWAFRYVRWKLGMQPEQLCTCWDPWTCGRPHASPPKTTLHDLYGPLEIEDLAPLSEREERVFKSGSCPRCERHVTPYLWKRQICTMKCPWCDHLVDPAPMPDECICDEPDDTGWVCQVHPKQGGNRERVSRRT